VDHTIACCSPILPTTLKKIVYRGNSIPNTFMPDWNCISLEYDDNGNATCAKYAEVELKP